MTIPGFQTGYEGRLQMFGLDEPSRTLVRACWPIIARHFDRAMDDLLAFAGAMPGIGEIIAAHGGSIRKLEFAHFEGLFSGNFDGRYMESCQNTVQREAALGLDGRMRNASAFYVQRTAIQALARQYRFSPGKLASHTLAVSQAISFDIANAMTLHRDAATEAEQSRRQRIDESIVDFSVQIASVIDAITRASKSLTASCGSMKVVASDSFGRLAAISAAAVETSQRVQEVGTATGALSDSIEHIGKQAGRGLAMAQAAVGEALRTHDTINSLNETADRIGSVIGLISSIASQTNLLALNATIEAARAGEAGKGFAVVAAEVKALAGQTTRATDDIARQVSAIQEATKRTVDEIAAITKAINELTSVTSSIASAVEEQGSVTRDIAGSMQTAASSTSRASEEIRSVEQFADQSVKAVDEIGAWTRALSASATDLELQVTNFFNRVRAA